MEIADHRVATVHFTLTDEQGQQITTTRGHDPLVYLHGTGRIVPALEEALNGKQPGERFTVTVTPEQGFGPRHEELVQTLPLSMLGENAAVPKIGAKLRAQTGRGPLDVVVTAVAGDQITVDGNNPLAGRTFQADVEVLDVRLATPQEIQTGL
ncbi:FKBP-type peptidyl-prolyl cis-trans isomerase [Luteimonas aquatica]|uniref:FKBP-type peptidyl-prolyl cis-trans isomerase n=1 Tax=Luteimonas aquatica TaxID=450364 RepID=UPI001F589FCE|nr:peptidylprolyl isomerase [Luteimonas aquatica]